MIKSLINNHRKQLDAANMCVRMGLFDITVAETFENIVSKLITATGAEFWEVNEALGQTY